jgi:hypothetical protein
VIDATRGIDDVRAAVCEAIDAFVATAGRRSA